MPDLLLLNATLDEVSPKIWRELVVPGSCTFHELHAILQISFGWESYHLYQFRGKQKNHVIGSPDLLDAEEAGNTLTDSRTHTLINELNEPGKSVVYEYDFGDGWEVKITVQDIFESKLIPLPECVRGARSGPKEDSGGPYGYMDLVKILADKKHPEYKEFKKWAGRDFDPEKFNPKNITKALANYKDLALALDESEDMARSTVPDEFEEDIFSALKDGDEERNAEVTVFAEDAITVRPRMATVSWLKKLHPKKRFSGDLLNEHDTGQIFLIPPFDSEEEAFDFIRQSFGPALIEIYMQWFGPPENWPQPCDWETFTTYFEIRYESMVMGWPGAKGKQE